MSSIKKTINIHISDSRFCADKLNDNEEFNNINWYSAPGAILNDDFINFCFDAIYHSINYYESQGIDVKHDCMLNVRISAGINECSVKHTLNIIDSRLNITKTRDINLFVFSEISFDNFIQKIKFVKDSILTEFGNTIVSFSTIPTIDLLKYNRCRVDDHIYSTQCDCNDDEQIYKRKSNNYNRYKLDILNVLAKKYYFYDTQVSLNKLLLEVNDAIANNCFAWQPLCPKGSTICPLARDTQKVRRQGNYYTT